MSGVDIPAPLTYSHLMTFTRPPNECGKPPKYDFYAVANGTPFSVPREDVLRVRSAASHWGKRHGVRLLVRKVRGEHMCQRVE